MCYWFSSLGFPTASMNNSYRNIRINGLDDVFDHVTTIVNLSNNSIGFKVVEG